LYCAPFTPFGKEHDTPLKIGSLPPRTSGIPLLHFSIDLERVVETPEKKLTLSNLEKVLGGLDGLRFHRNQLLEVLNGLFVLLQIDEEQFAHEPSRFIPLNGIRGGVDVKAKFSQGFGRPLKKERLSHPGAIERLKTDRPLRILPIEAVELHDRRFVFTLAPEVLCLKVTTL
jgi:hypothetical protein